MKLDEPAPTCARGELDVETTTELFHRYGSSLFAYLRQHTASREDAEDLLHEVFAIAMERQGFGLLSDKEQERWLWRVTRNKAVDTYRRKTRRPALALDYIAERLYAGDEQSPEYALLRREEYASLLTALERLPAIQQEALRLRFVNDLPCAEVAKALGKREGAVRSILSRAIQMAMIYNGHVQVVATDTNNVLHTYTGGNGAASNIAWQPRGTSLLISTNNGSANSFFISLWNTETGSTYTFKQYQGASAQWSSDGKYVWMTVMNYKFPSATPNPNEIEMYQVVWIAE